MKNDVANPSPKPNSDPDSDAEEFEKHSIRVGMKRQSVCTSARSVAAEAEARKRPHGSGMEESRGRICKKRERIEKW